MKNILFLVSLFSFAFLMTTEDVRADEARELQVGDRCKQPEDKTTEDWPLCTQCPKGRDVVTDRKDSRGGFVRRCANS